MKKRRRYFEISLIALSLAIGISAAEIGLRLLTPFPVTPLSNKLPDEILNYTLDHGLPDVDRQVEGCLSESSHFRFHSA